MHTHICLTPDLKLVTQLSLACLSMSMRWPMAQVEFSLTRELRAPGYCTKAVGMNAVTPAQL